MEEQKKIKIKSLIFHQWNCGESIDKILSEIKSTGKTHRNGNELSKTYLKIIIQNLIQRGELKKRPVVLKK